ncbi:MAG: NAD(+) synthase [Candidatus Hydrogenedentes bacterium]|nr:NAD(+) synthase [Candidatus Hydrogenedentota bacterium]
MRLVKIGTANLSVKVGDFNRNVRYIKEVIAEAEKQGVNLLVLPELAISGYSLEDRVYWDEIVEMSWKHLVSIAEETTKSGICVFLGLPVRKGVHLYNASALIGGGKIWGLIPKQYIPSYHIFYETRYWSSWDRGVDEINGFPIGDLIFDLPYGRVSAEICEDIWVPTSPSIERVLSGAEIICNLSASPFNPLKNLTRRVLVLSSAVKLKTVYVYSNLLGYDGSRLVFDGGGIIATPEGKCVESPLLSYEPWTLSTMIVDLDEVTRNRKENSSWKLNSINRLKSEGVFVVSVDIKPNRLPSLKEWVDGLPRSFYVSENNLSMPSDSRISGNYFEQLFHALALGLRDYYEKVGVFEKFLVALSGGRDSALTLLLAVEAAKHIEGGKYIDRYAEKIESIYLPHKDYSSSETLTCAKSLAEELGVPFKVVSVHEEAELAFKKSAEIMGDEDKVKPITRQNLQARIRGAMMLNWANNVNGLLLVTSNLSESAVGYTTTGGDNEGGFSPIANVPKTVVSALLEYLHKTRGIKSLEKILSIPPTAELAPNQTDEEDLMPYRVLDDLIYLYAEMRLSLVDCWKVICYRFPEFDKEQLRKWTEKFARQLVGNQWKRDQHPVSLKVLEPDFDPKTGFRFPITQSIEEEIVKLRESSI